MPFEYAPAAPQKIAVIGAGISGMGAAHLLSKAHDVTLYESAKRLGGQGREFDIRQHLNGAMICEGVVYGPTGRVNTRFVANMNAKWVGNDGHMTEEFRYDTGGSLDRE